MRRFIHVLLLAMAEYWHERLLSLCAILGLAAVLTPLLLLYGVKFGIMTTLTDRLLQDPRTLEITPISAGHYSKEQLAAWANRPDVSFVMPRTRSIAATMRLVSNKTGERLSANVSLEPTGLGDPLLARYGAGSVTMIAAGEDAKPDQPRAGLVLTDSAARALRVQAGDVVIGALERRSEGRIEKAQVRLLVTSVLPNYAEQKQTAYVPLELLLACEDYRDNRAVPELGAENGWTGSPRPEERTFAGFRLYARSMPDVAVLSRFLEGSNITTYTHAEDIDRIETLEKGASLIFTIICAAAAAGFFVSTCSSVFAGIKRKERLLGLLQLTGFPPGSLMLFPLTQALLTGILGSLCAIGLFCGASYALNTRFADALEGAEGICRLLPEHMLLALGLAAGVSLLAALPPALSCARIEASEVIRDV